jgi:hypothetical protein
VNWEDARAKLRPGLLGMVARSRDIALGLEKKLKGSTRTAANTPSVYAPGQVSDSEAALGAISTEGLTGRGDTQTPSVPSALEAASTSELERELSLCRVSSWLGGTS